MKNFKKVLFVLFISLAVTACKKDDEGGDDGQAGEGQMVAKVDGQNFQSLEGTVMAQESNSGVRTLAVSAGTVNSENLQMIIINFDGEGTYDLNFTNIGTYSFLPDPSNPDPSTVVVYSTANGNSSNGTINISSYSTTNVKGTFSFTGYNINNPSETTSVTEGSFDMALTQN
ncbi:hypothetical protein [Altibacter sp.]|uniref:hypothetical protein n=1 Tax=Altibacter sp. TaxID=2024823 RepID=UPI00258B1B0C|nr:hypothetical protein [Altibacter sp.]MCW9036635.1 hypothetical protein [Altibacter sp.]